MPVPSWTPEQAQFLRNNNQIRPDQFASWEQTQAPAAPDLFGAPVTNPAAIPPTLDQAPPIVMPPAQVPPDRTNPFLPDMGAIGSNVADAGKNLLIQSAGGTPTSVPGSNTGELQNDAGVPGSGTPASLQPAAPGGGGQGMPVQPDMGSLLAEQTRPFAMQQGALKATADAAAAAAAEEQAAIGEQQRTMQKQLDDNLQSDTQRQQYFDTEMQKLQKAEDEVSKQRVDPERFWTNKSTGQKILAGIGLFLGAFGAARTGQNPAVQVIQDAINRDIDQQKFDIQGAKEGVQRKRGIFGDMMALYKDQTLARQASQIQGLNIAKLSLDKIAARYKGVESQQKAVMLSAQIEEAKQKVKAEFASSLQTRAVMNRLQSGGKVSTNDLNTLPEKDRERSVGSDDLFYGFAPSKEAAQKARDILPATEQGRSTLKQLIELAKNGIATKLSPTDSALAEQLSSLFRAANKEQIVGVGAISDKEWAILEQVVADPAKMLSVTGLSTLQNLQKVTENRYKNFLKVNSLTNPDPKARAVDQLGGKYL